MAMQDAPAVTSKAPSDSKALKPQEASPPQQDAQDTLLDATGNHAATTVKSEPAATVSGDRARDALPEAHKTVKSEHTPKEKTPKRKHVEGSSDSAQARDHKRSKAKGKEDNVRAHSSKASKARKDAHKVGAGP